MIRKLLPQVAALLIIQGPTPVISQGWLDTASPEFTTIVVGYESSDDVSTFSGEVTRTLGGSLDLSLGGVLSDNDGSKIWIAEPGLTLYPLAGAGQPYSVGIGGTYGKVWFTGDIADFYDDISGERWSVFAGLFGSIPTGGGHLAPSVEVRRIGAKVEFDGYWGSGSDKDQFTRYQVGLAMVMGDGRDKFFVRPLLTISEGETDWSLTIGTMFGSAPPARTVSPSAPRERLAAPAPDTPDRRLPYAIVEAIQSIVARGQVVQVAKLAAEERQTLSEVFQIPAEQIDGFRWGASVVPSGSNLEGSTFYEAISTTGESKVVWVDEFGSIIKAE